MYEIRRLILGSIASVTIDGADYESLHRAREGLSGLLAIEEKYDLLVRSYVSFERVIHELALSNLMFSESSWSDFIDHMQAVNLELMSHLAMCRTYVDHVPQNLNGVFGPSSSQAEQFKEATSHEYDAVLGYRVFYALRNYVQHCGLPVHSLTFSSRWLRDGENADCVHAVEPYLSTVALAKEGGFKSKVLAELHGIGEKVDIRPLVRENMSSFGRLHKLVRLTVNSQSKDWDTDIEEAINCYSKAHGEGLVGL